eukprot:CAMPEP_0184706820 /NCGR_PEP_ID=MMETSP0313-20130426/36956_1 /TAXON_ID=2792 /ORGANISM="Porphyridium aerugineum, Strain SAG 1380-2" /LENGTH=173 /DNA_ID=CAMNT_0027168387 /DNA_START=211 /DNA_END=732 /DNA_ORIENTATION=-
MAAFIPTTTTINGLASNTKLSGSKVQSSFKSTKPVFTTSRSSRSTARSSFKSTTKPSMAAFKATEIADDKFDELVLKSSTPVLVDFYAVWCGPCKLMAPLMDWAASEYGDKLKVYKIDTEKNPRFVKEYKIYGLPTMTLFENGKSVAQVEGALPKKGISEFIEKNIPSLAKSS